MHAGLTLIFALAEEGEGYLRVVRGLFDEKTLPVTSSALAVLVSIWAVLISRKSVRVSERSAAAAEIQARHAASQADAAERQAVAAMDQATSASSEASVAHQAAQISALEGARARIDAALPRVAVVMFKKNNFAGLAENSYHLPVPLTDVPNRGRVVLEHWPQWSWDAFFVSHGLLYNFGSEPAVVISADVQFYSGVHPFTGEDVPVGLSSIDGALILYPGQHALFQVFARKQVDDWVNILEERKGEKEACESYIWFFPADSEEPHCGVKIRTEGMPLSRGKPEDVYAVFVSNSYFRVSVEFLRKYPESEEEISAALKGDKEELAWISIRRQQRKLLLEAMARAEAEDN